MDHDKLIERVRKLLAMSKDTSSPNEAAIAARRARKLIDDHQLSEMELTTISRTEFGVEFIDFGTKVIPVPLSVLALYVARYNDCVADIFTENGVKCFRFKGMLVDSVTAIEMFRYLRDEMYSQAERNADGRSGRHDYRNGFAAGIAAQVKELLKARKELKASDGRSLMVMKNQLVTEKFGSQRAGKAKTRASAEFTSGYVAGKDTSLARQVSANTRKSLTRA